jgi:hypothetical protein
MTSYRTVAVRASMYLGAKGRRSGQRASAIVLFYIAGKRAGACRIACWKIWISHERTFTIEVNTKDRREQLESWRTGISELNYYQTPSMTGEAVEKDQDSERFSIGMQLRKQSVRFPPCRRRDATSCGCPESRSCIREFPNRGSATAMRGSPIRSLGMS